MTKLYHLAFGLGLVLLAWIGAGFAGASWLALGVTTAIASAYLLGAAELRQFRGASRGLRQALEGTTAAPASLAEWLQGVPALLREPVRLRVQGERTALPGPALTPYLVGLLVMLGMLGTFLGMIVTFRGAVFALEGSADLQAIRAALAAPMQGLGVSFGTSVAGVAASAMLGLMAAIARRERLEVLRLLEGRMAGALQPFSLAHQREVALQALQAQAHSLPAVVDRLDALLQRMDARSEQLDGALLARHAEFQRDASRAFDGLAGRVGAALAQQVEAGSRAAADVVRAALEATMAQLAADAQRLHERLGRSGEAQVEAISARLGATADTLQAGWTEALAQHGQTSRALAGELRAHWLQASAGFAAHGEQLAAGVRQQLAQAQQAQVEAERARLQAWTQALQDVGQELQAQWQQAGQAWLAGQQQAGAMLERAAADLAARSSAQQAAEGERLQAWAERLQAVGAELQARWRETGAQLQAQWRDADAQLQAQWREAQAEAQARQQAVSATLEQAAGTLAAQATGQAERLQQHTLAVVAQSEALLRSRAEAENRTLQEHQARMEQLAELWRTGLQALREDEAARGAQAVARLDALQAAVGGHLASLGAALEGPLTRLLQTAAEVPQAAAGVIAQLRAEMARATERDNAALQERDALLARLGELLQRVGQGAEEQRAGTLGLVAAAEAVLEQAGRRFAEALQAQSADAGEATARVAAGAVEVASLAQAFAAGVERFQSGNDKLLETLDRIEASLLRSTARSDEQLAYYVAQAREVIDLSIASQQGLVESLRELQGRAAAPRPLPEVARA